MKPAPFEYHAPTSLAEATALLAELGDEAKILAGGQSFIPMLAFRLTAFEHLVDVGRIPELKYLDADATTLRIGAGQTHTSIGTSPVVATASPLLHRATPLIGYFQIRNRGTIGGALSHADPASEYAAVALTLDAEFDIASAQGTRTEKAADFFQGHWTTTLEADEILTGVRIPVAGPRSGYAIEEFAARHRDFAAAGAAVAVTVDEEGTVANSAIGLLSLGPTPLRATAAEQSAVGTRAADVDPVELGRLALADLDSVPTDTHAPASYRTRVGATMVRRAWTNAIEEALSA